MATGGTPVEVNTSRSLRGSSSPDRNQEKCPDCSFEVKDNAEAIECDICKGWDHKGCQNVSDALYAVLISDENQQIRDILMSKLRQAEEQCIPKKRMSQRARKYPVPLDVKTRATIKRKHRLWKKFLLTKDVQNYQEFCRLRNQVRRLTREGGTTAI